MALLLHALRSTQTDRHSPDVINLRSLDGMIGMGLEIDLIAEHSERHENHIDIASGKGRVEHRLMACGIRCIKINNLDAQVARTL